MISKRNFVSVAAMLKDDEDLFVCLFVCCFVCLFDGFNAIFNNISAISWRSVLLVEETGGPEKTTNLSQVTDKLY
jgi:hypothetical protein